LTTAAIDQRLKTLDGFLHGKRPLSRYEQQCIHRQMDDLQHGHERGLHWEESEAVRVVEFAKLMRHWKGRQFRGKPFIPEPWQVELVLAPLFGWKRESQDSKHLVRRYNEGYEEVPRKNGKSFKSAVIATQGLLADAEQGPEVYSAASIKEQAGIVFKDCREIIAASPLVKHVNIKAHHIECPMNAGIMRAVSSDYNVLQGLGPSRVIIDELQAHKTSDTYDAIISGMGARESWLLFCITTAGHNRASICWERRQYAERILAGDFQDDTFFTYIAAADENDDFMDPDVWWKANPNLGVSVFRDFLEREAKQAQESAARENLFRRLHLNQWTEQSVRWIQMSEWDACKRDFSESDLIGKRCVAGLDLANTRDVNALVLLFPEDDGSYKLLPYFWIPEDAASKQAQSDKRLAMAYADEGWITTTRGNTSDFDGQITTDIANILSRFDVIDIAFDPWGPAPAVVQRLVNLGIGEELFVEYRQTIGNFAGPTKDFERLIAQRKMLHNGNPVLRFMASNVVVKEDANGNIRPDKGESANKIDGIVSAIMAYGQWTAREEEPVSIYETRGVLTL